ncbi:MAG TPA: alanine dehydrogenase [Rhodothermia bacterium]
MESPEYSVASSAQAAVVPMEKPLKLERRGRGLTVGVPREQVNEERRVALSPSGVSALAACGHDVIIERGAGKLAHFPDGLYTNEGAEIADSASDIYGRCDLVVKVAPPSGDELNLLREKQILISALHLGNATKEFFGRLMELSVTGIGFEFIKTADGTYPIVRMMHEIMGSMSIQIAARYLESAEGGAGLVLGGISGVPPAHVLILGAGVVGEWAARTALGFGARVTVLDSDLASLMALEHYLDRRITTAMANEQYIRRFVGSADVIIGAMVHGGSRSPVLVTEEMVASMRPGSVVVDAVIDQGGCIETSRPTSHSHPVFTEHGVIHYCVPNMPSNAARTATDALTNVLVPFLLEIGDCDTVNEALWRNEGLRNGTYVYRRHLTKKSLASLFGMPHRDIELLIASGI